MGLADSTQVEKDHAKVVDCARIAGTRGDHLAQQPFGLMQTSEFDIGVRHGELQVRRDATLSRGTDVGVEGQVGLTRGEKAVTNDDGIDDIRARGVSWRNEGVRRMRIAIDDGAQATSKTDATD
ncbi:MAG: hypothetical protein AAF264_01405 [Pseudomonadota bacterium]